MRSRSFAVLLSMLAAFAGVGGAVALGASSRLDSPTAVQTETEAGPHIFVPSTTPCTETLISDAQFSGYYAPATGTYNPTCKGPWSKVVLTLTGSVSGDQYDRLVDVTIGSAMFLHGSTSEPDGLLAAGVQWSVQRDVTQLDSLLSTSQPVKVWLNNVTNSTYTGVYGITVSLTFYPVPSGASAPAEPNVVIPVTNAASNFSPLLDLSDQGPGSAADPANEAQGQEVTFPRNMVKLTGELYASGGGTCEEFFWEDPLNCDGTPYREVDVYIDGTLAGAAPVYPSAFTGDDGPDYWEPIPSTRAWDLVPYDVDLTPFVGELSDGKPHDVTFSVGDAVYSDDAPGADYWFVAANLLAYTDPQATVTGGTVTPEANVVAPVDDQSGTSDVEYTDNVTRSLTFAGTVDTSAGDYKVLVHDGITMSSLQPGEAVDNTYTWDESTTTTSPSGNVVVDDDTHTYSSANVLLTSFGFTDDDTQTDTLNGNDTFTSTAEEEMNTVDPGGAVDAGAQADVEDECYQYSDSSGNTFEEAITAAGGQVVDASTSLGCLGLTLPSVGTGTGTTTTGTTTTGTGTTTTGTGTSTTGTVTQTVTSPGTTTTVTSTQTVTSPGKTVTEPGPTTTVVETVTSPPRTITETVTVPAGAPPPSCTRTLLFRLRAHKGLRFTKAVVYVNGRWKRTFTGHSLRLLKLPRPKLRRFKVRLVETLSNGRVISRTFSYRGCN